jgi:hypothetical protein
MDFELLRGVCEEVLKASSAVHYLKLGFHFSQKDSSLHCFSSEISVGWAW